MYYNLKHILFSFIWFVLAGTTLILVIANGYSALIVAFVAWVGGVMTPHIVLYAMKRDSSRDLHGL